MSQLYVQWFSVRILGNTEISARVSENIIVNRRVINTEKTDKGGIEITILLFLTRTMLYGYYM